MSNTPKAPKLHIIKTHKSGRTGRVDTSIVQKTLEGLIQYFSYTLEIGNSWNKKINRNPKTINAFVKALQASYEEKEAACYDRTSVYLLAEIPSDFPNESISK